MDAVPNGVLAVIRTGQICVGGLYAPRWNTAGSKIAWDKLPGIREVGAPARGWSLYTLECAQALVRDDTERASDNLYHYQFFVRHSGPRFLVACPANEIMAHVAGIARLGHRTLAPRVDVAGLVAAVVAEPGEYVLSALYARVEGYGQSLRSATLYGSDLADAKLFREILDKLTPYRVTLRTHRTRQDVLTVSSQGDMSFYFRGKRSLEDVDSALRFLARRRFMDWSLDA